MGSGVVCMIFRAALIPSRSGRPTAIKTISGAVAAINANAVFPLAPSPTTLYPLVASAPERFFRDGSWSLMTKTLLMFSHDPHNLFGFWSVRRAGRTQTEIFRRNTLAL